MQKSTTCNYCGTALHGKAKKQCGKPECKRAYTNQRNQEFRKRWKEQNGEPYAARYKNERYNYYTTLCVHCRKQITGNRKKITMCQDCVHRTARDKRLPVLHPNPAPVTLIPEKHPARQPAPKPVKHFWVNGQCARCATTFTTRSQDPTPNRLPRYCSPQCQKANAKAKRRALKRGALHAPYRRIDIFERDKWTCGICKQKVNPHLHWQHPQAPTIDHIIALANNGPDTPDNVQCAHRNCNTKKGTRTHPPARDPLGHSLGRAG